MPGFNNLGELTDQRSSWEDLSQPPTLAGRPVPGTADQNNSTWMPQELEGLPRNGIPTWALPGEKQPTPGDPGMEKSPAPEGEQPTDQPTPDYIPTALQRYQTPNGVPYSVDDSVGERFQRLF